MSVARPPRTRLCALQEIEDPGSRGFRFGTGVDFRTLFVVRRGDDVFAYENHCSHTGSPLDWVPDRFLDRERRVILCATHGARFRIEDGACLGGPCAGTGLTPVPIAVEAGVVYLLGEISTATA